MIIWKALQRIFARHFLYHMAIPLFFGAVAEVYLVVRAGNSLPTAVTDLLAPQHVIPVLAVIGAYLLVMLLIVTTEASTPFETSNFALVEEALRSASSYFALCDIPMREWFEPGAFKYFALLQSKKESKPDSFKYERVIILKSAADKRNAEETVLDRYYADALAMSHRMLKIPMGWLKPSEFREIMNEVPKGERHLFQRIPSRLRRLPPAILRLWRWPAQLDYAVIERPSGKAVIIVPFKKTEALVLDGQDAAPYLRVAEQIKARVYDTDGVRIRGDHDFLNLMFGPPAPQ